MNYPGMFLLVIGASGSGKGALLKRTKELHPEIVFPLSSTTRAPRPNESHGQSYEFLSQDAFQALVETGEFLEWASIDGKMYGTRKANVLRALEQGALAIKEMDVQGVRSVQEILPKENLVTVYIDAGPWEALVQRITGRAPMAEEELVSRKMRFDYEQDFRKEADFVVQNFDGKFKEADAEFEKIVQKFLKGA